ncbi:MAG: acyltransferase family protein [Bacillota bacterium]
MTRAEAEASPILSHEPSPPRQHYLDWLRIFGILLLFPYHTARVFDYWEPNYVKNALLSWPASWFIVVTGYWFMPLLFWLAGAASWYALQRRTAAEFVRERTARLFVPFVFGLLVIVPPQAYLAKLVQPGYHQTYWAFLAGYVRDFSDGLSGYFGGFTPAHLWFILYLFIFSAAGAPLLLAFRDPRARAARAAGAFVRPWAYISLFFLVFATEAVPAPGGKNPFLYFFFYLAGYVTTADARLPAVVDRIKRAALLSLTVLLPAYLWALSRGAFAPDWSAVSILLAFLRDLTLWLTLTALVGYGRRYLNRPHPWLPYLNRAAYPVYIVHQTVLVVIAFFVVRTGLGVGLKFTLIAVLSFLGSLGVYELIIRRTAVTRWLLGVKTVPGGGSR